MASVSLPRDGPLFGVRVSLSHPEVLLIASEVAEGRLILGAQRCIVLDCFNVFHFSRKFKLNSTSLVFF